MHVKRTHQEVIASGDWAKIPSFDKLVFLQDFCFLDEEEADCYGSLEDFIYEQWRIAQQAVS